MKSRCLSCLVNLLNYNFRGKSFRFCEFVDVDVLLDLRNIEMVYFFWKFVFRYKIYDIGEL